MDGMAITCPRCGAEFDATLFEFGHEVRCACGMNVRYPGDSFQNGHKETIDMDTLEAIRTRRSVRKYLDKPVGGELIQKLLAAAMQAPSARNQQPWQFVVIEDRATLAKIPEFMPNAAMVAAAPLAILVCGDMRLEKSEGYWVVDCSAATENMLLAAHALGLGACWCGVYPRQDRMEGLRKLLGLPPNIIAHSLVVLGQPAEQVKPEDRYRAERVRHNRWK
jgi:nitroreductase